MSPCFSCRVTCLCAQFEAVLQHGMKRSRGLALTAAAIKQAAGFASKTETGTYLMPTSALLLVCLSIAGSLCGPRPVLVCLEIHRVKKQVKQSRLSSPLI